LAEPAAAIGGHNMPAQGSGAADAEEGMPLLGAGKDACGAPAAAAEKPGMLDALGPVTSTLLCLPVLVAH